MPSALLGLALVAACTSTPRGFATVGPDATVVRPADPRLQAVRARVRAAVAQDSAVALSIAVAVRGQVVWEEAFGWADRERRVPASPATVFGIASIAKPLTATALMTLVERGGVSLDRQANTYLGAAKITRHASDFAEPTVRQLLQHRAGLPEQNRFYFADDTARRPPLDSVIRQHAFLATAAGERYEYSNLGYGVVERIIELQSGRCFAAYMDGAVFRPLGLRATSVGPAPGRTALLYDERRRVIPFFDFDSRAAGYVYSTAHDVLRFGLFHLKERLPGSRGVLSAASIDEMIRGRETTGSRDGPWGLDWWYGLGWGGRDASELSFDWHGHEGGMPGASTILRMVPSERAAVVVLSNSRQALTYALADTILDALLPEWSARRRRDATRSARPTAPPAGVPPALVGEWRGHVLVGRDSVPLSLTASRPSAVTLRVGDGPAVPVEGATFADNMLSGRAAVALPSLGPPSPTDGVRLHLWLHGRTLRGDLALASAPPLYPFWLPHWVELRAVE